MAACIDGAHLNVWGVRCLAHPQGGAANVAQAAQHLDGHISLLPLAQVYAPNGALTNLLAKCLQQACTTTSPPRRSRNSCTSPSLVVYTMWMTSSRRAAHGAQA